MTKTLKLLCPAIAISALCGFAAGLVRAEKLFNSPFPAFYIVFILSAVLLSAAAYIIAICSKAEGRENLTLYKSDNDAKLSSDSHTLPITIILLFGAGLVAIAALRAFLTSRGSTIDNINFIFVFICAFSLAVRALNKEQSEKTAVFSLCPIYYLCLYLLLFYRDNARGANLDAYGPQALTISVLVFAAYFNSAVKFDARPAVFRYMFGLFAVCLFVNDITAYFMLNSTLTSADPAFFLTMTGGFTVYFAASLFTLPLRLFKIKKNDKKKIHSQEN